MSRSGVQQVARHLYRRGNSFEFRRAIPAEARHLFGDVATYSRSFGDVTRREADHLAAEHRKHFDKLIALAANELDPTAKASALRLASYTPSFKQIDRAVRSWVVETEHKLSSVDDPFAAKQTVRDMTNIAEVIPAHQRENRQASLLQSHWIADAIATRNGWTLADDARERRHLLDRIGRALREVA